MKTARYSYGIPYTCLQPWPSDCFVQCGDNGVVLVRDGENYITAFFEAFPRSPDTFIRGEGKTVEIAEATAFTQFEKYVACTSHEFEAHGYENGGGFCKHCNMFGSNVIPPHIPCRVCKNPTWYGKDKFGQMVCKECTETLTDSELTDTGKMLRRLQKSQLT